MPNYFCLYDLLCWLNLLAVFQCYDNLDNTVKLLDVVILNNPSGSVFGGSSFSREGWKGMKPYL